MPASPHVVVIGGGFAGLSAAKVLGQAGCRCTVIDRTNHHLFQPLLYQVATAGLSPGDIATPIRTILRRWRAVDVLMAEVTHIDPASRTVKLERGDALKYDYLVVATGARHSYFAHPEWEMLAPGLKTLEDAVEIRRRILVAFEEAERATDPEVQRRHLTFVVVGAGPTGIETAGAIAELARFALASDYKHINPRQARVILVEAGSKILAAFSDKSAISAQASLERMGIQVLLNRRVTKITAEGVDLGDGQTIQANTVVWAAGVVASKLGGKLGAATDAAGRVQVSADLSVPGHPEIFVVGDLASVAMTSAEAAQKSPMVPGVAPAAIQMGEHAARNILALWRGAKTQVFRYRDKGSLATIGRAAAVAEVGSARLSGYAAWLAWLAIHIVYLIGFRNKILVLIEWAWSYVTYQRGARLITGRSMWKPGE